MRVPVATSTTYRRSPEPDISLLDPNHHPAKYPLAIPIFVNELAGTRRGATIDVARAFTNAGLPADIRPVDPLRLRSEIAGALRRGVPLIGIAGGDGTVRTAAETLVEHDAVLAPLPTGTLNHFARRLGFTDVAGVTRAIAASTSMQVPLGISDDRIFLNTASFGIYAGIVARRDRWRDRLTKWGAAFVATAIALLRLRQVHVVLDADGVRLHRTTALVWIGVGRGSFPFSYEARVGDPRPVLEVVIVRSGRGLDATVLLARLIWRLLRGKRPHQDPGLEVFHTRTLVLRCPASIGVTLDGEVYSYDPPILIAVLGDALRVVSPDRDG